MITRVNLHRLYGLVCVFVLGSFVQPRAIAQLTVTDDSPDHGFGTRPGDNAPGGRVKSLVVDPNAPNVLYAGAELSGVWKSVDAGMSWHWSSNGIRTGFTANNYALAVDTTNSNRVIYAASDDDGRVPCPGDQPGTFRCSLGGLYVSDDAGSNWSRVSLPNCPAPGISSVVFASGQPFVATRCGIYTTTNQHLAGALFLPVNFSSPPASFSTNPVLLAAVSGPFLTQTLFACAAGDTKVYRSVNPGVFPAVWTPGPDLGGGCMGLAVLPPVTNQPDAVVVIHAALSFTGPPGVSFSEVAIVSMSNSSKLDLGFAAVAAADNAPLSGISGTPTVYAAGRKTASINGPSFFDIYAADGFHFFVSEAAESLDGRNFINGPWKNLAPGTHADTWAAAAPSTYDPASGVCAAYVGTDGGVYENSSLQPSTEGGCDPSNGWVEAMSGLHVMYTGGIAGFSTPPGICPFYTGPQPPPASCPALYLPTGDNDVWVTPNGLTTWEPLGDGLGDAGQSLLDPALPGHVVSTRGGHIILAVSSNGFPPDPSTGSVALTDITPSGVYTGIEVPGGGRGVVQILNLPSDPPPTKGDYLTIQSVRGLVDFPNTSTTCPVGIPDSVVRKAGDQVGAAAWVDLSPGDHFGSCQVAALAASGGRTATTIYVLTSVQPGISYTGSRAPGQLWRGRIDPNTGEVPAWFPASGTPPNNINQAWNFFVNPYDPQEIYVVDVGDNTIKFSNDAGANFYVQSDLTSIATNNGEFRFGCSVVAAANPFDSLPRVNACALSGMAFGPSSGFRVAALYLGGVAISRDSGQHWIPLDITNNTAKLSPQPPIQLPVSLFYDSQPNPQTGGNPTIYAGLQGQSIIRIDGPFSTLASVKMRYCATCATGGASQVLGVVDTLGTSIPLRLGADGFFAGRVLFDSAQFSTAKYHFVVDGQPTATFTHTFSAAELAAGVITLTNAATTLKYTGPSLIANGLPVQLSAVLQNEAGNGVSGQTVSFSLISASSAQACTGVSDSAGAARCSISAVAQTLGPGTITATFSGNGFLPSLASTSTLVFAFLNQGAFVIGNGNASKGQNVTFWGYNWAAVNALSGGNASPSFKGFAGMLSSSPLSCGGRWSTSTGNSSNPPVSVPSYMATIVSSSVAMSGAAVSGDVSRVAIVRTNPGYAPDPSTPGTGTVVAFVCP